MVLTKNKMLTHQLSPHFVYGSTNPVACYEQIEGRGQEDFPMIHLLQGLRSADCKIETAKSSLHEVGVNEKWQVCSSLSI